MNKKNLILSMAVLVVMSGMNMVYAADESTDDNAVKNRPEAGCPVPSGERPDFGEFQGPPPMGPKHFECGPGERGPKHFEGRHPSHEEMQAKKAEIDKRLKLTDEQKQKIELQKQQDREKIKPIMNEMQAKKKEFKTVLDDESLSPADKDKKIKEIRDSLRELKTQAESLRKENMNSFENILTDKQKKEFSKIKEEQKKEMEQRKKQFEKNKDKNCSKKNSQ